MTRVFSGSLFRCQETSVKTSLCPPIRIKTKLAGLGGAFLWSQHSGGRSNSLKPVGDPCKTYLKANSRLPQEGEALTSSMSLSGFLVKPTRLGTQWFFLLPRFPPVVFFLIILCRPATLRHRLLPSHNATMHPFVPWFLLPGMFSAPGLSFPDLSSSLPLLWFLFLPIIFLSQPFVLR